MTRVKICGLTRPQDAEQAVQLGAWALGMIMWRKSPRYCTPERAAEIAASHHRSAQIAGVFVDQPLDEVVELANGIGLTTVQLHGDEGRRYCDEVARRTGAKVTKAFRVRDRSVLTDLNKFHDVDYHLLDTYKAGVPGGTGESFDWSFLRGRGEGRIPLILSGGLTAENVASAIETVRPFAVDVASGVESEPGVKDAERMQAFFEAVRSVPEAGETAVEPVTGAEEEVLTLKFAEREAAEKAVEREAAVEAAALAAAREAAASEREAREAAAEHQARREAAAERKAQREAAAKEAK
ncbi:MAG: phosphoribosylanthranilate isomerase [Actinobacteria bacterium]|nr:phosphoribosylanthranilate isomerase [Actinomycetota bacterium]